jgi:hypothetical protein
MPWSSQPTLAASGQLKLSSILYQYTVDIPESEHPPDPGKPVTFRILSPSGEVLVI